MDSQDEQTNELDLDAELEAWLRKGAEDVGLDPDDPYGHEQELIMRWQQNPNPEDFGTLYNAHQGLIYDAARNYLQSTTLPKAAVKGFALQRYTHALQTYDPNRNTKFSTHVGNEMRRVGRYLQKYQNVGKIPEDRAGIISLLQASENNLKEMLGRLPTDVELSEEMLLSAKDVADLKKGRITPKAVATLRRELRSDLTAELKGGQVEIEGDSPLRRQIVFLHGSLNPEQQLVLEHTYDGFGKPVLDDDMELGRAINMSPQKIRALKAQIKKKVDRFW